MSAPLEIEDRVKVSVSLQRYLRAIERFEAASAEFSEACQRLRQSLPKESRVVASISYKHYLVTSDQAGNFEVEEVETV